MERSTMKFHRPGNFGRIDEDQRLPNENLAEDFNVVLSTIGRFKNNSSVTEVNGEYTEDSHIKIIV